MNEDNISNKKLFIQLYSIHGLIRGHDLELGRDADTGGQTKYVIELANALSADPRVDKVELVTRLIKDKNVSSDYSQRLEKVNNKFTIVRIKCGGEKYIRKELLWQHLEEFIDRSVKYIRSAGRLPDIIHSHYADAGYVCSELTKFFGMPFIHTGHSLGKEKLRKLLEDGMKIEEIEKKFKISHRINIEEDVIYFANLIITSTRQEVQKQYACYTNTTAEKFRIIPPGVDLEKFFPFNNKEHAEEETLKLRAIITEKLLRFFVNADKPMILSISRAAKKKNISNLITAYGEDKNLQQKANLAIFAGIRKDIQTMEENEKEVLTEILLLMDKYDLYGKLAIPKKHDSEHEVPELYRIAAGKGGVFVNPAFTEPFGLTLIEAAATGVPVVSTDDGGPRDIIANCKNGLLVDVTDPQNIAAAINKVLDDKNMWNEFSENGIKNVKKYYSWNAHVDSYLNEIFKLLSQDRTKANTFEYIGKKLFNIKKLIVTDIDNTLLGDDDALEEFILLLNCNRNKTGFAVATGRSIDSTVEVLNEHAVPKPDVIISSVGSEIFYNDNGKLIYSKGWDNHISHLWKRETAAEILKELEFLDYQEKEAQRKFKISYIIHGGEESLQNVKETLMKNKLKVNLIFSHNNLLDILPYRASKGKAIRYLSFGWDIPYKNILIAGDSGNDIEMLKGEMLGIVVANYCKEFEPLKGSKNIYFAGRSYAGGIIDGISHYDFLSNGKEIKIE